MERVNLLGYMGQAQEMISRRARERNRKGFTLLEIIIVLVIMVSFISMAIPFFGRLFPSMGLNNTARQIVTVLRTARSYAITNNANYNVVFTIATEPDRFYITNAAGTMMDKGYPTPVGVNLGANDTVTFTQGGGLTNAANKTVTISAGSSTKTINVNGITGVVQIQ